MKNRLHIFFSLLPIILFLLSASNNFVLAENSSHSLHFCISDSHLDETWMDNLKQIQAIQEFLNHNTPSKIQIISASSPDGPYSLNKRLSEERAQTAVNLVKRLCPSLPDSVFVVNSIYEDIDGTINYLSHCGQSWAEDAISLLCKGGSDPEEALRHYKGGIVWRYLADNVYPQLRRSEITFIYDNNALSAGLTAGAAIAENVNNQSDNTEFITDFHVSSNSTGKVPVWAFAVMALFAIAALGFGVLYARERRRNRDLIYNKDNVPVEPIPPSVPSGDVAQIPESTEPTILPSEEAVIAPVVAAGVVIGAGSDSDEEASFLGKVKSKIQENIADSNFGVEELAAAMGISRIHLNRKLKTESESSPSVLLKEARMELAAKLLREGDKSISEISTLSGFSTPSYFATAFKDYYNISPSEYITRN